MLQPLMPAYVLWTSVKIFVFSGLCRICVYSLETSIIFSWISKKNEFMFSFATSSNISSDGSHWLFCRVCSLQFCGLCKNNTYSGHVPLTEVSMDSLELTQFFWQCNFLTFSAASSRVLGSVVQSLLLFFLSCPYSSACYIAPLLPKDKSCV